MLMSVMKKKMKFCPDLVFFLTFSKLHDSTVGSVFILCCRSVALRTPPTVLLPTVEPGATLFGYIINCKVSCWRRVCSPTRYWEISMMECLTVASCAVAVYNAFFCMTTVAVTLRGFQLQWERAPFHYHSVAPSPTSLTRQSSSTKTRGCETGSPVPDTNKVKGTSETGARRGQIPHTVPIF